MILNEAPLRVVANPYHTLDHQGLPTGAARLDPEVSAGQRLYIGAHLADVTVVEERSTHQQAVGLAPKLQRHRWRFDSATQSIADTPYHRGLITGGVVFPADEVTHRKIFKKSRPFVAPDVALAQARHATIASWQAEHEGEEPAFVAEEAQTTPADPAGEDR